MPQVIGLKGKYDQIKSGYIAHQKSLKSLAEQYGVSYDAVRKVASREKWSDQLHEASRRVTQGVIETVAEQQVNELSAFNEGDLRLAKAIRGQVAQKLGRAIENAQKGGRELTIGELGQMARIVADCQRIGRLALGITTDGVDPNAPKVGRADIQKLPPAEYMKAMQQIIEAY